MFLRCVGATHYWTNALLFFLFLGSSNTQAAWQTSLSDMEIQAVNVAANNHFSAQNRNAQKLDSSLQTKNTNTFNTELGFEVLFIELQEVKFRTSEFPRLAEVYVFNYVTGIASVMLVDVESQRVVNSRQINNIHLPLNDREVQVATQLVLNKQALKTELALEYEKQTGKPLVSLQQLDMKVSIWNPGNAGQYSQDCKLTRCALVSLFTKNHYNFSVEPVVNLSTSSVNIDWVQ